MKHSKTCRGFEIVEFQDIYGAKCSLQQSSLAKYEKPGTSAVWLGCDENCFHDVTKEPMSPRMHLDRKLAKQIIVRLQRWLDHGSFK